MKPPMPSTVLTGRKPRIPTRVRPWWSNYATYLDLANTALFATVPLAVFRICNGDWHTFPATSNYLQALRYPPLLAAAVTAGVMLMVGLLSDLSARQRTVDQLARDRSPQPGGRHQPQPSAGTGPLAVLLEDLVLRHGPITLGDLHDKVSDRWGSKTLSKPAVRRTLWNVSWLVPREPNQPYLHVVALRLWETISAYGRLDAEQVWRLSGSKDVGVPLATVQGVLAAAPWVSGDSLGYTVNTTHLV